MAGRKYLFYGSELTQEGVYTYHVKNEDCDTLVTLNLVLNTVEFDGERGITVNEPCAGEGSLDIELAYSGVVHRFAVVFSEHAHSGGMNDTLLPPPDAGVLSLPLTGVKAGWFQLTLNALFREQTVWTESIPFAILYPSSVMEQRWNDVIAVLTDKYNGGYDFTAFQWYKDGQPLPGEEKSYIYQPLDFNAEYAVLLTEQDGTQLMSCSFTPEPHTDITLYPTLADPLQYIHCYTSDVASLVIYDATGRMITGMQLPAGESSVPVPEIRGLYIVKIQTDTPQSEKTYKVLIR